MPLDNDARELLGSRILAARRRAGLTMDALAKMLPRGERGDPPSRQAISQYEIGKNLPSINRIADIAHALGTTLSDLVVGVKAGPDL